MKGKNVGAANGMYGKEPWTKTHSPLSGMTDEEIIRWKEAISESNKGRVKSADECKKLSESHLGNKNPMFRKFYWKDENGYHTIDMPDTIKDEDLSFYRMALHYIWDNAECDERHRKDWRKIIERLTELCLLMDKYNT